MGITLDDTKDYGKYDEVTAEDLLRRKEFIKEIREHLEKLDEEIGPLLAASFQVFEARIDRRLPALRRKSNEFIRGAMDKISFCEWSHETYEDELIKCLNSTAQIVRQYLKKKPDGFSMGELSDTSLMITFFADFHERFTVKNWLRTAAKWSGIPFAELEYPLHFTGSQDNIQIQSNIHDICTSIESELCSELNSFVSESASKEPRIEFRSDFQTIELYYPGKKNQVFRVGPKQAKMLKMLHKENQKEHPWIKRDDLLKKAGYSTGGSMKRRFHNATDAYEAIIDSQQRGRWMGHYRLKYTSSIQ